MKKVFLIIGLFIGLLSFNFAAPSCEASITVSDVLNGKKPYILLVYTSWSNADPIRQNMFKLSKKYKTIVFKAVNINNQEAAALFDKGPMTFGGFPYIQMARGKVGSYVEPSCARDYACFDKKIKKFFK